VCLDITTYPSGLIQTLRSTHGRGSLAGDLGSVLSEIDLSQLSINHATALQEHVLRGASVVEIWSALFPLIARSAVGDERGPKSVAGGSRQKVKLARHKFKLPPQTLLIPTHGALNKFDTTSSKGSTQVKL